MSMQVKANQEGKTKDVSILNVTPENFIVPKGEEHLYHCRIEVVEFDRKTGKRMSVPRMQTFGRKAFESFVRHNLIQQGYEITVMHDPKEWERIHKAEAEAIAKEKAVAEAKAAEEAKNAEIQALREQIKAEVLADLKRLKNGENAGNNEDGEKKPGRKAKE